MTPAPKPRRWRCKKCQTLNEADATRCSKRGCRAAKPRPRRRPTKAAEHRKLLRENRALYEPLLELQGGHCALCPSKPKATRKLDLDHDHKLMKIRGLLCVRCNKALRSWMTPALLRRMADYLERPPAEQLTLDE